MEIDLDEFNMLVEKGFGVSYIKKHFKCSDIEWKDFRKNNNITYNFRKKTPIILTDIQISVLYGALLGDGCMPYVKKGNANFSYISSEEEHVQYILNYFKGYLYEECSMKPKRNETYDKRTEKVYVSYIMRTQSNTTFQNIRDEWYVDGKKIIPEHIKLNPLICLIWYLGDGHIANTGYSSHYIKLSTDGFDPIHVENVLMPQLKDFNAYLLYRNKEKTQSCVMIPRIKIKEFLLYIGVCPIECYKYKWLYKPAKSKRVEEHGHNSYIDICKNFIEEYLDGEKVSDIAKKYKCDVNLIKYYLKKNNIELRVGEKTKYSITHENGENEIIDNMAKYAKDNKISYSGICSCIDKNNKYRGMVISRIKN